MNKRIKSICVFVAICLSGLALAPGAARHDDDTAQLRRENIRLRMRVAELERLLEGRGATLSSLDEGYAAGEFFSLTDRWDEFSEPDDVLSSGGLAPLERIDTILVIPHDEALTRYIDIYTVARSKSMVAILRRFDRYRPQFEKTFARYGVPRDFVMLSIVESAVNPKAVSHAGAVGMWQIMKSAASQYGLRVSDAVDDRLDVGRATDAAARILRDNYRRFGDWGMAVMAYNCGAGRMEKAVAACGDNLTYENLYAHLPRETREYLPALVAAMYVNSNRIILFPESVNK